MLTKIVDGVEVEMSPEEEAMVRAEWAANAALPEPVVAKNPASEIIKDPDQLEALKNALGLSTLKPST